MVYFYTAERELGWRVESSYVSERLGVIRNNKFESTARYGLRIIVDLEKRQRWFGRGKVQGIAQELSDVLSGFQDIEYVPRMDSQRSEAFFVQAKKSQEGAKLFAEFIGADKALTEHYFPQYLTIHQNLRDAVVDSLAGALVKKKKADYQQLIFLAKSLYDIAWRKYEPWKDQRKKALDELFDQCMHIPDGSEKWDEDTEAADKLVDEYSLQYKQKLEANASTA